MAALRRNTRCEHTNHARFLTFSCFHQFPRFGAPRVKGAFAAALTACRTSFQFHLYGWVIMPEHVHLLLWPCLPAHPVSQVLRQLKGPFAEDVIAQWRAAGTLPEPCGDGTIRFWQKGGGHDRNIFSDEEFYEKLEYIHMNPVKRGLVSRPEEWPWSSARWYARMESLIAMDPLPPRRPGGSGEDRNRAQPKKGANEGWVAREAWKEE